MSGLWRDVRFGFSGLVKRPGFTFAALASLLLGISANTAVFTLLDALFLRPLPVEDPGRLVAVFQTLRNEAGEYAGERSLSYPNYLDYRERSRSFESLALSHLWKVNLSGGTEPLRAWASFVTANYFETLGLEPAHGRFFEPQADAPGSVPATAVLSYGCWRRVFGSDPGAVGSQVRVNGESLTVVGVAPAGFRGTFLEMSADVFVPILSFRRISPYARYFEARPVGIFDAVGRLAPGVTVEEADAEVDVLARQLAGEHPKELEGYGGKAKPLLQSTFLPRDRERYSRYTLNLLLAVLAILVIACLNVSSLLYVRGLERARELALRQALGAGRGRLIRQLMTENILLFLLGGLAGLPATWAALRLLWSYRPPQISADALGISPDPWVFGFALATAFLVALVFGILPAARASRGELTDGLKEMPAAASRTGVALRPGHVAIVAQVALTLLALIGAGLFLKTLRQSTAIDLGFASHRLLVASVAPGEQGYDDAQTRECYRRLLERAGSLPGVEAAALSESRLLRGATMARQVFLDGAEKAAEIGERSSHRTNVVAPGFFETVGIALLRGRDFTDGEDAEGLQVAIVNETMAETAWPGEPAIGRRFRFDYPDQPPVEVVGVVADARYRALREEKQFFIYLPLAQRLASSMTLHVRTAGDPSTLLAAFRREVQAVDPTLPLSGVATLDEHVGEALWLERASAALLGAFGVLALTLAVVGLYGLLAYSVSRRSREMGIRAALGARRGDLARTVLGEAVRLVGTGLAVGLFLALFFLEDVLGSQLYGVSAVDLPTYVTFSLVLFAVALLGGLLPAWRAARTDPLVMLRAE